MAVLMIFVMASVLAQGPAPEPGNGSIAGMVLRTDTGEPLEGVRILIHPADERGISLIDDHTETAVTDDEGRYRFEKVPAPGWYMLEASREGYVAEGRPDPRRLSRLVRVDPGRTADLDSLRFSPEATPNDPKQSTPEAANEDDGV